MLVSQQLLNQGYQPVYPGAVGMVDRPMAEYEPCEKCGGKMEYRPRTLFKNGQVQDYRAFAVCIGCQHEVEFTPQL